MNPGNGTFYYTNGKGEDIQPETYWCFEEKAPEYKHYFFRFIEIRDGAGGLHALIQDKWGYTTVALDIFNHEEMRQVTDGKELALVMLSIHG